MDNPMMAMMAGGMGGGVGNKVMDRFFRKVDDATWDLMTGKLGIRTADGILTLEGEGDEAQVNCNLFDNFGIALPAFAQNTPVEAIKKGDLIYNAKKVMGWVIKVPAEGAKSFTLLKPDGTRGEWRPTKVNSIGLDLNGAMVLRSLVNNLGEGGLGGIQNMLLPMMMMGGDLGNMESILPALLFTQMNGGKADATNPMASMLPMMMMMAKMFNGGGSGCGCATRPAGGKNFFVKR